jgi:hypothetical protein
MIQGMPPLEKKITIRERECGSEAGRQGGLGVGGGLQLEYSFGGSLAHAAAATKDKNRLATQ